MSLDPGMNQVLAVAEGEPVLEQKIEIMQVILPEPGQSRTSPFRVRTERGNAIEEAEVVGAQKGCRAGGERREGQRNEGWRCRGFCQQTGGQEASPELMEQLLRFEKARRLDGEAELADVH
jgi:hypothetical protein